MANISKITGETFACPSYSIFDVLQNTVQQYCEHTAMIFFGKDITYRVFRQKVEQIAAVLYDKGVRKGDRVAVMLPNCPEYVISFYACARLGAILVQVNPMYVQSEVDFLLKDSDAIVWIVLDQLYSNLRESDHVRQLRACILVGFANHTKGIDDTKTAVQNVFLWQQEMQRKLPTPPQTPIDPEADVAVLQYTGGTTGRSKGAMLTHQNIVANAYQSLQMLGKEKISAEDKILTVVPLFHVYGMTAAMNLAVINGAAMILLPRFQIDEVLQTIQTYRPRFFPGVPTMYMAIANHPNAGDYGVDCIDICNSGSAPLPYEVMKQFETKTGAKVLEGYGLSEASPVTHSMRFGQERKPGSIGMVAPGTEAGIVDVTEGKNFVNVGELGELVVRGPQVMKGYWNMPDETAQTLRDGWLYTGDIARMDEDGYFYIVDRKKDMILSSGYNVYPRDVEEVLYKHPNVQEAVVIGVPDAYRGETVKAFVVMRQKGDKNEWEAELDRWCRAHLAPYKVPRMYEFRDQLPKTAVGKILRRELRQETSAP
ncbi:long-chain fatty acid--CoA ligase [Fodinisporobacter ferrooxydans]|uniref:Long-chain fatty acid--CoA ligase n=1 Tax=Fodinisporobacter ferrooxydans TaxID=2901836 RepID=A0ABY4CNL2_9BACL|nr:long-chain fatty acid--CoA ligase [Alicyclobacillaceae bacterium MYW30-H2]